jgi:hypothetical protein
VQVLQRLRDAVRRKRRDKWQGQWLLHHDTNYCTQGSVYNLLVGSGTSIETKCDTNVS